MAIKRHPFVSAFLGLLLLGVGAGSCWLFFDPRISSRVEIDLVGDSQRGAYVLRLAGCVACHTNSRADGAFLAGGALIETEFGVFYPPNITPHLDEGIGTWSRADFFAALTRGKSPEGSSYYPAFPYTFYTRMKDQDIADLWAALKQVTPAKSTPGTTDLGFPFSQRILLSPWRKLFFRFGAEFPPDGHSPAWERGRYIVEGPGHCGACHTPRNLLGARKGHQPLAGSSSGPGGERVPPITREALVQNGWSSEDIVFALEIGLTPEGDFLGGSMGQVVREATSHLTKEDLQAIAIYLLMPAVTE